MKAIFIKNSISIEADLATIQDVLIQYKNVCEWEKGFDSFKEVHVSKDKKKIVHWDIEHDIDYIFNFTDNGDKVLLELRVGDLSEHSNKTDNIQQYIDRVLIRIKDMSERLQIDFEKSNNIIIKLNAVSQSHF